MLDRLVAAKLHAHPRGHARRRQLLERRIPDARTRLAQDKGLLGETRDWDISLAGEWMIRSGDHDERIRSKRNDLDLITQLVLLANHVQIIVVSR